MDEVATKIIDILKKHMKEPRDDIGLNTALTDLKIESLDLDRPTKPLLHMLWPLRPEQLDRLVEGTTSRRRAAGIPGDADAHWREESRRLERLRRKKRRA